MHATGFTGNMNMCVTTSVYCTQGCRQMDETTHSESSTVVSSPGHLQHVRTSESLVLKLLLLQFIGVAMNSKKGLLLNIYVRTCNFPFLVLLQ